MWFNLCLLCIFLNKLVVTNGMRSISRNLLSSSSTTAISMSTSSSSSSSLSSLFTSASAPELNSHAPMKILLIVEPTPFNYVSGYANRFKEMLKYLKEAGDDV